MVEVEKDQVFNGFQWFTNGFPLNSLDHLCLRLEAARLAGAPGADAASEPHRAAALVAEDDRRGGLPRAAARAGARHGREAAAGQETAAAARWQESA